jgi:hypothetical protein
VISIDELKLRIFAAIDKVTPQMLKNSLRKIEYNLDNLHTRKGTHVEVV